MQHSSLAVIVTCLVAIPSLAHADDAFVSAGFLKLPDSVEVGAMSSVAVDAEDNVYVLHRGSPPVLAFDAKHQFVRGWGEKLFKVPHGLRVDKDGNIWTTDNGNHVLRKFSKTGELLQTIGAEGKGAGGKDGFRAPD